MTIDRVIERGYEVVEGSTPAVLVVVEKVNDPRYRRQGIMAATDKPGHRPRPESSPPEAEEVGLAGAATDVVSFENARPRQAGRIVKDESNAGVQIAEFLAAKKRI